MLSQIEADIKAALKRGDKPTAEALKFLKSVLLNARIAANQELTEDEIIKTIRKEIKLRIEARDIYAKNQRSNLAAKEEFERNIYARYVPEQLSDQQILVIVKEMASDLSAPVKFSDIMPLVMKKTAGLADGKTVSEIIKKYLEGI